MEKKTQNRKTELERTFYGIGVWMQPGCVHVENNRALKKYMGIRMKPAAELASYLKKAYEKEYGKPLGIDTTSLAVELIGHYAVQEIFLLGRKAAVHFPMKKPLLGFMDRILQHTDVIDCGEKACDNNRFVWDILAAPVLASGKVKKTIKRRKR